MRLSDRDERWAFIIQDVAVDGAGQEIPRDRFAGHVEDQKGLSGKVPVGTPRQKPWLGEGSGPRSC